MKKYFKTKKTNKILVKSKYILLGLIIIITIFKILDNSKIKIKDQNLVKNILYLNNNYQETIKLDYFKNKLLKVYNEPFRYLPNYKYLNKKNSPIEKDEIVNKVINEEPLIYIYNSHQTEEYAKTSLAEYSIEPTVMMADYILEQQFNNSNYKTIVEERSIPNLLRQNKWRYVYSYKASRIYLEDIIKTYPSLKYFIDVHRDSLKKERTTIEIDGKQYAKLLFIVGLENPNYKNNLALTEEINNKINELYPNLSKGIYKKSGPGVNGIYNQDFSPNVILIEMGGYQNTPTEVMNSSLAFSKCYLEVIKSHEKR